MWIKKKCHLFIWPVERVLTSCMETELCSTQSTPCDTVTGVIQAAKGTLQQQTVVMRDRNYSINK